MSLDVYLKGESATKTCYCPLCGNHHMNENAEVFYSANITHNLIKMAEAAGIYNELWRPDEIGITKAVQLITPLNQGLSRLKAEPDEYKRFNPTNQWGCYDDLVWFVEDYIVACMDNPNANVEVSR